MARVVTKDSIFGEGDSYSFRIAIRLGQIERVSKFIKERYSTVNLGGLLHYALSYDQIEIVRLLITKFECSVDCRNEANETPLHLACRTGDRDVVRMFVSEYKADLLARDNDNNTPLSTAVTSGHDSVVSCLIDEFTCSPNVKGFKGQSLLHQACDSRNEELAKGLLLDYHLDPLAVDDNGDTVLHTVASNGSEEMLNLLITKYKCPVDSKNSCFETPLHYACKEGNVAAVRVLISQHKADMNALDSQNFTPLDSAARSGQTDVVKCFIDKFNYSLIGSQGITILQIACFAGHVDLAETLIAHYNLDPKSVDDNGNSPLHFAATICDQEMLSLLITKYECPVDCRNCTNETPLHWACQKGNTGAVRILVSKYNADLTAHCMGNSTPLNEAALNGHTDVVKCLIDEFGCSIDVKDDQNRTILHSACREGHTDLVETLLSQYSLDPLSIDEDGNTPLHAAASKGQEKVVNLLLSKYNCPVDRKNNTNQTPLHCACSRGDLGTVKMLITEHKADLYIQDEYGNTPAMVAALDGKSEAVKSLIDEFGYDPSSKGYDGRTLLHQACISGNTDQAEVLITCYNLDPVAVDDSGNTPLHLAALKGNEEMVKVLITKYQCRVNCKNTNNELPLDLALVNDHQNIVDLLKKGELETDKDLLPMIPREGYICAARNSICIVQTPSDIPISVIIDSVDDVTFHPKLHAREFLLTPIVRISSDTNEFCPNKQAVVELLKTIELQDCENNPIPMFSDTRPSQPPRWRDLNPDDFEVLQDRIVFNTTHFSLFTVIARLPTPTNSVTVTQDEEDQEPIELTLSEVSNVKVVIPPCSIKSESVETEIKITANFDHPSLCDESFDATACITLEPHGLEFKERMSIRIPIPDYAQIRETYSNAKLQFLHSNDSLDSKCASWIIIPEGEYETVKEDGEYVGIVYSTHFSNRKAVWLNIPKKIKREIQGPIHKFRRCIAKKALKRFSGRCQVFMSSEAVIGSLLSFSIAALLHPLQEFHEIPKNYCYMLYDSEKTPITVKGSTLKLTVELADYCSSKKSKIYCKEVELSGDFSTREEFDIELDSSTLLVVGAVLGKLSIEHGQGKAHTMNLIKVKLKFMTIIIKLVFD